jgi:hypothetical protein
MTPTTNSALGSKSNSKNGGKPLIKSDGLGFCPESFRKSWSQAIAGETLPLYRLWEEDNDALDISSAEQAEIDAQFGTPDATESIGD